MTWPFHNKALANYWLKVFALYALAEACIQLVAFFILNNFGTKRISIIEYHLVLWFLQCLLVLPVWWVASSVRKKKLFIQILVNLVFYALYSYCWFGPVQHAIAFFDDALQHITRAANDRQSLNWDWGNNFSISTHAFRLSWFFVAAHFYNYRLEEKKRLKLAVANKELQLQLLKWRLNPSFYFNAISHLRQVASERPANTANSILQLAKVMEYVIYEAQKKLIDVKKEIEFLDNYIQLLNQQNGNKVRIEFNVTGEYAKLKIAPLVLAGVIDKIAAEDSAAAERLYKINLQFSGNEMQLTVNGGPVAIGSEKTVPVILSKDDTLYLRLKEIYPERFSYSSAAVRNEFKLYIQLDEER